MKNIILLLIVNIMFTSCFLTSDKTRKTINEGGENVGKTASEFIEGISEGVHKSLECEISLSQNLKDKGISTGKFYIANDSLGNLNNVLTVYFIFEKDFNNEISVKIFDKNNLEMGRTKIRVQAKAQEAKYYDFKFDKRTNIEVKSKIVIE